MRAAAESHQNSINNRIPTIFSLASPDSYKYPCLYSKKYYTVFDDVIMVVDFSLIAIKDFLSLIIKSFFIIFLHAGLVNIYIHNVVCFVE